MIGRSTDKHPAGMASRLFGRSDGAAPPRSPDLRRTVDDQITAYRNWRLAGCPAPRRPSSLMRDMIEACTSADPVRVGALAGHTSSWVRLGVAGNPHAPMWAVWGDVGLSSFGLAEDPEAWVAASVILHWPSPPPEIVAGIRAAADRFAAGP